MVGNWRDFVVRGRVAPMRWSVLLVLAIAPACQSSDVSRSVGARCDQSSECDERCLGPSGSFPGGFCTVSCDHSSDCEGNEACIDSDGGACVFRCVTDTDCTFLGDYMCKALPE